MTPRATFGHVLTRPVFRELFFTRSLAISADVLRTVALSTAIFTSTGSAWLAALAFGLAFVPQAFTGVLLGPLADRVRPRLMIAAGYAATGAATGVLGLVAAPTWAALAVVTAIGCFAPAFNGTTGRLMADVLDGDAYVLGRSLMSMAMSFAQVAGLAFGGLVVAAAGSANALLISAGCLLAAAAAVWFLMPEVPVAGETGSVVRQGIAGARELLGERRTRALLWAQWLPPAFAVGAESLVLPYALGGGLSPGTAGIMIACVPVGMIVGEVAVGRLMTPARRERSVAPLVALLGVPLLGFAVDLPVVVACLLLAASGAGFAYTLGLAAAFRDAVPERRRGQAFALLSAGLMTAQGIGPVVWGGLAEVATAGTAIAAAGLMALLSAIAVHRGPLRTP
ncbi:MFS transporter [Actinokineospora guangxiensis]|uniref:MFS transporter n=1 Tax=Actinokineospora guangxiensis TaxID=1490288 RepID=A0ABW0EW12_9PSEU